MADDLIAQALAFISTTISGIFATAFGFLKDAATGTLANALVATIFFAVLWWKWKDYSTYVQIALLGLAAFFALKALHIL